MRQRNPGGKFKPENMARLMTPEGRQLTDPDRAFDLMPLKDDHAVAVVGCGNGFFAIPLAKRLPKGKVYAFDVQDEMVQACRANAASAGLTNVEAALSEEMELPLAASSMDGAFLAFSLHEIVGSLPDYMTMLRDRLKPDGWLAVLEWKREPMEGGPPLEERLTADEVREIVQAGGLTFASQPDLNPKQYMLIFTNGPSSSP